MIYYQTCYTLKKISKISGFAIILNNLKKKTIFLKKNVKILTYLFRSNFLFSLTNKILHLTNKKSVILNIQDIFLEKYNLKWI